MSFPRPKQTIPAALAHASHGYRRDAMNHTQLCYMGEPEIPPGNPPEIPPQGPPEMPPETPPVEEPPEIPPEAPPEAPPEIPPPPEEV